MQNIYFWLKKKEINTENIGVIRKISAFKGLLRSAKTLCEEHRNSRDFDFCPATPCYNPHTARTASWLNHSSFPLQSVMFDIALLCLPRYIKTSAFLLHCRDNAKVKTWHNCSAIPCPTLELGGLGYKMTGA